MVKIQAVTAVVLIILAFGFGVLLGLFAGVPELIATAAVGISLINLFYKVSEATVCLQLSDERRAPTHDPIRLAPNHERITGVTYDAALTNVSSKLVEIFAINITYGSKDAPRKRLNIFIAGRSYLGPGDKQQLHCVVSTQDALNVLLRFGLSKYSCFLTVVYRTPFGGRHQVERWVCTVDDVRHIFAYNYTGGPALT